MNKQQYLNIVCNHCKAFCNSERRTDREHKCPKLKNVAITWDAAVESAIEYLEENISTNYDYSYVSPKENGIEGDFNDKWEMISDFKEKIG